jgi:4-hydroxybenzoate polyprenyltransferase
MKPFLRYVLIVFDIVNDLRLHVLLNYFLVVSWALLAWKVSVKNSVEYAVTVACIAGFAYILNRYTDYHYDLIVDKGLKKIKRSSYLFFASFFLIFGFYFITKNQHFLVPAVLGLMFGVFYSIRTIFAYPFKNYLIFKNIFASGSKYIITLLGISLFRTVDLPLLFMTVPLFISFLIYEIIWDIRDIESDKVGNVKTIPRAVGKEWSLIICIIIMILNFVPQIFLFRQSNYFYITYELLLFFIISLLFVKNVRWFHIMVYAHIVLKLVFINKEVFTYIKYLIP